MYEKSLHYQEKTCNTSHREAHDQAHELENRGGPINHIKSWITLHAFNERVAQSKQLLKMNRVKACLQFAKHHNNHPVVMWEVILW